MNLTTTQKISRLSTKFFDNLRTRSINVFTLIMIAALAAFECFSFSTTEFALGNMLGNMGMGFVHWSTILSLAFCGMDLAGIARLLNSENQSDQRDTSSWFLLGAWVLAAAMNAGLTWWGVSVALYNQPADSILILDPLTFVTAIPVLVSLGVWLIRILIIGSLIYSFASKPKIRKQARVTHKPFGFKETRQTVPTGYKPINTQARSQSDPSIY